MNGTDKEYLKLLEKILTKGKEKGDRTGTGTISVFSHTLEMDMSEGFPLYKVMLILAQPQLVMEY